MPPPSLLVSPERAAELKASAAGWPSWPVDARQQGELELLVSGAFWPLTGYAAAADHASILADRQLADGTPWPLPISLDVSAEVAQAAVEAGHLDLRDAEGVLLAVLAVTEHFVVDVEAEAAALYDSSLPEGNVVDDGPGWWRRRHRPDRLAGTVEGVETATHWRFPDLRLSPAQVEARFGTGESRRRVMAAAREPIHRADVRRLLVEVGLEGVLADVLDQDTGGDAGPDSAPPAIDAVQLLVFGLIGPGADQAFDAGVLVRAWAAGTEQLPRGTQLVVLPLGDHGTGSRDAHLRRLVLASYGGTDVVDLADPADPADPVGPGGAPEQDPSNRFAIEQVSPADLRRRLDQGDAIPPAFTYPKVVHALRRGAPPLTERGLVLFLTGLSGSGKSTVAQALAARLADVDDRSVALLDGDRVRHHLSSELGFSREHRNLNIRRIGFVAAEIGRAGGIAICAPIAPYDEVRRDVRAMVTDAGARFVLVHVSTPLDVCEARDRKGLYAKARAGIIPEFTGISDPYELPDDAELTLDTTDLPVSEAVDRILSYLSDAHLVRP